MKKKIIALCLVVVLAITAITGATLAYFTDTDAKENVFTVGKVDITLNEVYEQDSKLVPAVFIPADDSQEAIDKGWGTYENKVQKDVTVTNNTGSELAYVRVFVAVPAVHKLDAFKAKFGELSGNIVNFTRDEFSTVDGKWNWTTDKDHKYGESWNWYTTKFNDIPYNVYVATYETALAVGAETDVTAINGIFMNPDATNEMIEWLDATEYDWKSVYVVAEGVQADGFDDAFQALNTAFGDPQAATNPYRADFSSVIN